MKQQIIIIFISFCFLFSANSTQAVELSATVSGVNTAANQTTDRIIVKYRANTVIAADINSATVMLNNIVKLNGASMHHHHNINGDAQVWQLNKTLPAAEAQAIANRIASDSTVEYAEPDIVLYPTAIPNDSRYNEQWNYFESTAGLNLPLAWDKATGQGVVVAVIDTGYRPHADLLANILPGYDMITSPQRANDGDGRDADARDPGTAVTAGECGAGRPARNSTWHGTHVAGTIAAVTNNNLGVAGVAYNAKILPVRALGKCGGYLSDSADGVVWASGGTVMGIATNKYPAKVINMSLSARAPCGRTIQDAINQAIARGVTVVVAAGNANQDASNYTPANCNGVITVAAINRAGGHAFYSNFGALVDIAAPGGESRVPGNGVLSTFNSGLNSPANDSYKFYQGTSMAAPHITGLAALLYSAKASITPSELRSTLINTARTFPATCSGCGAGIADAAAAVTAVLTGGGGTGNTSNVLKNGISVSNLTATQGQELHYTMVVPAGAANLQFSINAGSGDADIYIRFAAKPTVNNYDYRPYLIGNNETVSVASVQAGTYYVMVRAYTPFSGVTLSGNYTAAIAGFNTPVGSVP